MRIALIAWIALVPALAIAAPRSKTRKPVKKKPPVTKPEPEPAEPAPAPDAEPAKAPAGAGSGSGSGGSGPAADPPAAPVEKAEPEKPKPSEKDEKEAASGADVDTLRQEYLSLRDELFKSRARANAVESQLYSTRMQIKLTYTSGRYYSPAKASIRLDGATVYENATGAIAGDDGIRFDGFVAPGRHLITFRVEAVGKDDDSFASVSESQIVVKAVANKDLVVAAKASDAGNISYEWKKKEKGSYGLGINVAVKTQARADGKAKK